MDRQPGRRLIGIILPMTEPEPAIVQFRMTRKLGVIFILCYHAFSLPKRDRSANGNAARKHVIGDIRVILGFLND